MQSKHIIILPTFVQRIQSMTFGDIIVKNFDTIFVVLGGTTATLASLPENKYTTGLVSIFGGALIFLLKPVVGAIISYITKKLMDIAVSYCVDKYEALKTAWRRRKNKKNE